MELKYSAADLVKRSAAQIVYLINKRQVIYNWMIEKGMEFQSKIVKDESLANIVAEEMRGCYSYESLENDNKIDIFFCIDMIKNGCFYEIKSVLDQEGNDTTEYPEWYLRSSVLQCAFYKSLLLRMEGNVLFTPKFRLKEGYKKAALEVDVNAPYYLIFGNVGTFEIEVKNPDKIIDFYKNKISYLSSLGIARIFDGYHKWKEFDELQEFFSYKKIS